MKLFLKGHEYKYAVEQMLSTLFPGERPVYCTERIPGEDGMAISLSRAETLTVSVCRYTRNGEVFTGRAVLRNAVLTDPTVTDSLCQYTVKNAVYRAVRRSGMMRPAWGALTGVRPGKLMSAMMRGTETEPEEERRRLTVQRFVDRYDVTEERAGLCYETSLSTLETERSLGPKDICLYVGIPFCPTRCAYCSFVSQSVEKNMKLIGKFFDALKLEVKATAEQTKKCGLHVVSVYFGGGTPTTLSAQQLGELCALLYEEFDLKDLREFTVEAGRPDTITEEKLRVLRRYGVSRVSVNPQTMRDSVLEAIGRRHTAKDVEAALGTVRKVGGFDVNMDLIAGLPTDDVSGFRETVEKVLALSPENITVHTLSLKKGSVLSENAETIPNAAEVSSMLELAYARLRKEGYVPYYLYRQKNMSGGFENTGWMKPGHINIYNICMMEELCGVFAMGGGGSTKLIKNDGGKNLRLTAPKYPLEYIEQIGQTCSEKERIGEFYGV